VVSMGGQIKTWMVTHDVRRHLVTSRPNIWGWDQESRVSGVAKKCGGRTEPPPTAFPEACGEGWGTGGTGACLEVGDVVAHLVQAVLPCGVLPAAPRPVTLKADGGGEEKK